ncbi:hypothetical protein RI367_008216 [Sorochytrium milnesiophthora]
MATIRDAPRWQPSLLSARRSRLLLVIGLTLLALCFCYNTLQEQNTDQIPLQVQVPEEPEVAYEWPETYSTSSHPPLYDWRKHPTTFDLDKQLAPGKFSIQGSKTKADAQGMAAIREMMLHAWRPYRKHAMGFDNYLPLSRSGGNWMCDNGAAGMAATLVDALGTLHIMGLKKEYDDAAAYMLEQVDLAKDNSCNTFETTIRVLGGLNSVHSLTQDRRFLDRALLMGDALLPALTQAPAGIPYSEVNFKTGRGGGYSNNLSGASGHLIELAYLTQVSGDHKYLDAAKTTMAHLVSLRQAGAPYSVEYLISSGQAVSNGQHITIGTDADSFFEYLLKGSLLIRDRQTSAEYRRLYDAAIDMLLSYIVTNADGHVNLAAGSIGGSMTNFVEHLACFAGGMLMLGAVSKPSPFRSQIFQIGLDYTETCHGLYRAWKDTGLPPDEADLPNYTQRYQKQSYNLRPEVVESIFYAWRLTHDPKYREWAMDIAKAINSTARVDEGGFAALDSAMTGAKADRQESYFLSETLKYLYLTFTDDDVVPLEDWVFNTEAHPVRRH